MFFFFFFVIILFFMCLACADISVCVCVCVCVCVYGSLFEGVGVVCIQLLGGVGSRGPRSFYSCCTEMYLE